MIAQRQALLLAALHLLLVASLGGKLLFDRATRPRFWLKAAPVDPDLPIRGRYVSLRVEVPVIGATLPALEPRPKDLEMTAPWPQPWSRHQVPVALEVGPHGLLARAQGNPQPEQAELGQTSPNAVLPERMRELPEASWIVVLDDTLPFFIPEHVPDPSRLETGEELWVEVTLPKKGPLRPIRLAVKKEGTMKALKL